jgi:hypothetical protein
MADTAIGADTATAAALLPDIAAVQSLGTAAA